VINLFWWILTILSTTSLHGQSTHRTGSGIF